MTQKQNSFDLENKIISLHYFCDQINLLHKNVLENDRSTDEVSSALLGLSVLLSMSIDDIFETFTEVLQLDRNIV